MKTQYYRLAPLEPLTARDSRPQSVGGHTLDSIPPGVVAGAVRTALWNAGEKNPTVLKSVAVRGTLPVWKNKLYLPRPLDALVGPDDSKHDTCFRLRPHKYPDDQGLYCADGSLLAKAAAWEKPFRFCAMKETKDAFKPGKMAPYWTAELIARWLSDDKETANILARLEKETLTAFAKDKRVHVSINPATGTARQGILFDSTALDFVEEKAYASRELTVAVEYPDTFPADKILPATFTATVGGDRHLARFTAAPGDDKLFPRVELKAPTKQLRMLLATPAYFSQGWLPDWISPETGIGTIPNSDIAVHLVSAITERWRPISGWDYDKEHFGPKPMRRMVPEGSVYFFETDTDITAEQIAPLQLRSVCGTQDDRDGLGLAVWGNWNEL